MDGEDAIEAQTGGTIISLEDVFPLRVTTVFEKSEETPHWDPDWFIRS